MARSPPFNERGRPDCLSRRRGDPCSIARDVAVVTIRGELVDPAGFLSQVNAAAAALPGRAELVNPCESRHDFLVVFAAAMLRRRTVLLPPSRAPASIAELREKYPGCRVVDDSFAAAVRSDSFDAHWDGSDFIAAIGHTSGSTGEPNSHAKSFRSLVATTAQNAATLHRELSRQGRTGRPWIVATVPPQHMFGLETTVLLPLLEGFGIHGGRPLMPADVAAALVAVPPPRVLVSTPVHLRALVDSPAHYPDVAVVLSATAPLPRDLAIRIEQRFAASLIELFGSTETCAIATRRTALEDAWRPYPGVELAATGDGTTVRAPWLVRDERLHDVIDIRPDGTFTVVGRGSDVIEVAGKRASLADLTRRLQSIDGIDDAVVFQPPAREAGVASRCAALVVSTCLSSADIARHMRRLVDAAFVPRPIVIVPTLPRDEVGKLPRERLLQVLATSASRPRRGT